MRVVLALIEVVDQRVPNLRWIRTDRDFTFGSVPFIVKIPPTVPTRGDIRMRELAETAWGEATAAAANGATGGLASPTAACADETTPSGDSIATTAIDTTHNRQPDGRPACAPNLRMTPP